MPANQLTARTPGRTEVGNLEAVPILRFLNVGVYPVGD